jgi:UDP-N-acetylmuramate--alanine ligase
MLGTVRDVVVMDDYAHHPREIEATISAIRGAFPGRRLVAVFQPHLYSRTKCFLQEFASVLSEADLVVVTGIYAAREQPIPGVTAQAIADLIRSRGTEVTYMEDKDTVPEFLLPAVRPGDVVVTMGAGDVDRIGKRLLADLKAAE